MQAAVNFSKEMAEYRLKTVIAQAAVEEIKDELDSIYDSFQDRNKKIQKCDTEVFNLQKTIRETQDKINNFLQVQESANQMPGISKIENLASASCAGTKVLATENEKFQMYRAVEEIDHVRKCLDKLCGELENIGAEVNEYIQQKEEFGKVWSASEKKIEKFLEEIESVQDGLQDCIETLQPSDNDDSD